jgi:hypothetical protein
MRITKRAIDLFDGMEALKESCTCAPADTIRECPACKEWWRHHSTLHDELRLRPWQWPAYSNFEDDDPKTIARYHALKAASDAAGSAG